MKMLGSEIIRLCDELQSEGLSRTEAFQSFTENAMLSIRSTVEDHENLGRQYLKNKARAKNPEKWEELHALMFAELVKEMEENPYQDVLGPLYMENIVGKYTAQRLGQVFSPSSLCELNARMNYSSDEFRAIIRTGRRVTSSDPCCGSGAMGLAMAKAMAEDHLNPTYHLWFSACDLSRICCEMTYIQLSLWAIPAEVKRMDTLSQETFDVWHTPFYVPYETAVAEQEETRLAIAQ